METKTRKRLFVSAENYEKKVIDCVAKVIDMIIQYTEQCGENHMDDYCSKDDSCIYFEFHGNDSIEYIQIYNI